LRNDLVVHARNSVLALFIVLSSAVVELRNTDLLAGPQFCFIEMCIRMHEVTDSDSISVEKFQEFLVHFLVGFKSVGEL
jgi:hypothetical protein